MSSGRNSGSAGPTLLWNNLCLREGLGKGERPPPPAALREETGGVSFLTVTISSVREES